MSTGEVYLASFTFQYIANSQKHAKEIAETIWEHGNWDSEEWIGTEHFADATRHVDKVRGTVWQVKLQLLMPGDRNEVTGQAASLVGGIMRDVKDESGVDFVAGWHDEAEVSTIQANLLVGDAVFN